MLLHFSLFFISFFFTVDTPLWFSITCGLILEKNKYVIFFFIVLNLFSQKQYLKKWRQDETYDNGVHWSENLAINSVTRNICYRKLSLIIWIHLSVPCLGHQIGRRPKMCHKFLFLVEALSKYALVHIFEKSSPQLKNRYVVQMRSQVALLHIYSFSPLRLKWWAIKLQ